jgi:hypothetical protein
MTEEITGKTTEGTAGKKGITTAMATGINAIRGGMKSLLPFSL